MLLLLRLRLLLLCVAGGAVAPSAAVAAAVMLSNGGGAAPARSCCCCSRAMRSGGSAAAPAAVAASASMTSMTSFPVPLQQEGATWASQHSLSLSLGVHLCSVTVVAISGGSPMGLEVGLQASAGRGFSPLTCIVM